MSYFHARRELWLNGKKKKPRPDETADSITRLEDMVGDSQALHSDRVWEAGLGRISKRLIEGGRLKYNLPMHLLVCNTTHSAMHLALTRSSFFQIKILYAGWIRDGTWPQDVQAPESDSPSVQGH